MALPFYHINYFKVNHNVVFSTVLEPPVEDLFPRNNGTFNGGVTFMIKDTKYIKLPKTKY